MYATFITYYNISYLFVVSIYTLYNNVNILNITTTLYIDFIVNSCSAISSKCIFYSYGICLFIRHLISILGRYGTYTSLE